MPSFESRACKGSWEQPEPTSFRCLYLSLVTFSRHRHIEYAIRMRYRGRSRCPDTRGWGLSPRLSWLNPSTCLVETATATAARGG